MCSQETGQNIGTIKLARWLHKRQYWWHLSDSYNTYDHCLWEISHFWEHNDYKTILQYYGSPYFQNSMTMLIKKPNNSLCSRSVCSCIDTKTRQAAQERNSDGGRSRIRRQEKPSKHGLTWSARIFSFYSTCLQNLYCCSRWKFQAQNQSQIYFYVFCLI